MHDNRIRDIIRVGWWVVVGGGGAGEQGMKRADWSSGEADVKRDLETHGRHGNRDKMAYVCMGD